jgi:hypothetical protein
MPINCGKLHLAFLRRCAASWFIAFSCVSVIELWLISLHSCVSVVELWLISSHFRSRRLDSTLRRRTLQRRTDESAWLQRCILIPRRCDVNFVCLLSFLDDFFHHSLLLDVYFYCALCAQSGLSCLLLCFTHTHAHMRACTYARPGVPCVGH